MDLDCELERVLIASSELLHRDNRDAVCLHRQHRVAQMLICALRGALALGPRDRALGPPHLF